MQKTSPARDLLSVSGLLLDAHHKEQNAGKVLLFDDDQNSSSVPASEKETGHAPSTSPSGQASQPKEVTAEELQSLIASNALVNGASASSGSHVLFATDEWFAQADNLLLDSPPTFVPDLYCPQGKVMDGWETRRKRIAGHDWAVIQLCPSAGGLKDIAALELDTAHFTGNHAPRVSVEVANLSSDDDSSLQDDGWMPGAAARKMRGGGVQGTGRTPEEIDEAEEAVRAAAGGEGWVTVLPQTELRPGYEGMSIHRFVLDDEARSRAQVATHVRINYYPDGGVARLRVWGKPRYADVTSTRASSTSSGSSTTTNAMPRNESATSVMNQAVYSAAATDSKAVNTASPAAASPPAPLEIKSNWEPFSAQPYPHPELSSSELGGAGLACSNKHYGVPSNLIHPSYGKDMGDGWETARHPDRPAIWAKDPKTGLMDTDLMDWAVLKLGRQAHLGVSRIILDTRHFRGNFPESVQVEGCCAPSNTAEDDAAVCEATPDKKDSSGAIQWFPLLPRTRMGPDAQHVFNRTSGSVINGDMPVTHVRVTIYPDGGLSRVRIYGDASEPDHLQSHL